MFLVLVPVTVLFHLLVCLDDIYLCLCSSVAAFWERAAHSVNRIFSLVCLFVALVVSHFCFRGQDIGSECVSSWSLLTFYFSKQPNTCLTRDQNIKTILVFYNVLLFRAYTES